MQNFNKHTANKYTTNNTPAKPLPSREFLREHFMYNSKDGTLTWIKQPTRSRANIGDIFGRTHTSNPSRQEIVGCISGEEYKLSRLMMAYHTGEVGPLEIVDHINGDSLDNRIENLRRVSNSYNIQQGKGTDQNTYKFYHAAKDITIWCRRIELYKVDPKADRVTLKRLFTKRNTAKTAQGWAVVGIK